MKFAIALTALLFTTSAFAAETASDIPSYKANITRSGEVMTSVIYNLWSGEYPGPVIDINAKKKGTTKIPAYKSVRDLSGKTSCEVKNGVYHPWSTTAKSALDYYSIVPLSEYVAIRKTSIKDYQDKVIALNPGDKITEIIYFGEGLSGAVLESGKSRKAIGLYDGAFEELDKNAALKFNGPLHSDFSEQWIRVKCANGEKLFAEVEELLKTNGVRQGKILGYGEVGPAD